MATSVYNTVDIKLADGTEVELRPLPVKHLRKVLSRFGEYTKSLADAVEAGTAEDFDSDGLKMLDTVLECSVLALSGYGVSLEDPEEVLDIETMYKILDVGADIDLKRAEDSLKNQLGLAGA